MSEQALNSFLQRPAGDNDEEGERAYVYVTIDTASQLAAAQWLLGDGATELLLHDSDYQRVVPDGLACRHLPEPEMTCGNCGCVLAHGRMHFCPDAADLDTGSMEAYPPPKPPPVDLEALLREKAQLVDRIRKLRIGLEDMAMLWTGKVQRQAEALIIADDVARGDD